MTGAHGGSICHYRRRITDLPPTWSFTTNWQVSRDLRLTSLLNWKAGAPCQNSLELRISHGRLTGAGHLKADDSSASNQQLRAPPFSCDQTRPTMRMTPSRATGELFCTSIISSRILPGLESRCTSPWECRPTGFPCTVCTVSPIVQSSARLLDADPVFRAVMVLLQRQFFAGQD